MFGGSFEESSSLRQVIRDFFARERVSSVNCVQRQQRRQLMISYFWQSRWDCFSHDQFILGFFFGGLTKSQVNSLLLTSFVTPTRQTISLGLVRSNAVLFNRLMVFKSTTSDSMRSPSFPGTNSPTSFFRFYYIDIIGQIQIERVIDRNQLGPTIGHVDSEVIIASCTECGQVV